jgi:hypothetical protein
MHTNAEEIREVQAAQRAMNSLAMKTKTALADL